MQKANESRNRWTAILFLISLLVITLDQISKTWIRTNLSPGESLFHTGFFRITLVHNSGAAFGLFQGYSFALTIIAFLGIAFLFVYIFIIYPRYHLLDTVPNRIAIGLILGGTVGNLIDRLRFGMVTDFIDFTYWPAFNVADSAVTVGALLFACSVIYVTRSREN